MFNEWSCNEHGSIHWTGRMVMQGDKLFVRFVLPNRIDRVEVRWQIQYLLNILANVTEIVPFSPVVLQNG